MLKRYIRYTAIPILAMLFSNANAESLDFYFDYVEKQGITLGHYYEKIMPTSLKRKHPDYAQRYSAWQNKIPSAVRLLNEYHGALVSADNHCYKKHNRPKCKTAMRKVKSTGDTYTNASRALDKELTRVISYGKSKGLR